MSERGRGGEGGFRGKEVFQQVRGESHAEVLEQVFEGPDAGGSAGEIKERDKGEFAKEDEGGPEGELGIEPLHGKVASNGGAKGKGEGGQEHENPGREAFEAGLIEERDHRFSHPDKFDSNNIFHEGTTKSCIGVIEGIHIKE